MFSPDQALLKVPLLIQAFLLENVKKQKAVGQKQPESSSAGSSYPELVLTVLWPLVERPVIVEAADIVYAVETLDPLRHSLQLRHIRDV